jgi:mono/diheme cytochrome c family protein
VHNDLPVRRAFFILTVVLGALIRLRAAQTPVADAPRTTLAGVYTDEQALTGETSFANLCQACHNLASQSGKAFARKWEERSLWELFDAIKEEMPKDNKGTLTPKQVVELMAYLLKINGLPAAATPLSPEQSVLETITIELPKKPADQQRPGLR